MNIIADTSHFHLTIIGDDGDDYDNPPFPFILSPINQTTSVRVPKSQMPPLDRGDEDGVGGVADDVQDNFRVVGDSVGVEKWPLRSRSAWAFEGKP